MKKILFFSFLFFFFLLSKNNSFAADPHLFLSPTSGNYSQNFEIEIRINTGGQAAGTADVLLLFPENLLKAERVTKGTAFSEVFSLIKNDEGKLILGAYFSQNEAGNSYNGNNGLIATVTFSPLGTGTANINFFCSQNSTADSNIVEKSSTRDIIVCSANINGSYVINGGTSLPTPTLTLTPTPSFTSEPTEVTPTPTSESSISSPTPTLPVTGGVLQTFSFLGVGILILLTGLVLAF